MNPLARFPARLAGAPLDAIKVAAAVLMVGDHVDTILLDGGAPWLWRLGRIAYPLFALAAALHLARGIRPDAYAARLLLVAVPTQPVYAWAFPYGSTEASILVTLAMGAVVAPWLAVGRRALLLVPALALVVLAPSVARTGVDFGLAGVLLPGAMVLALLRPSGLVWLVLAVVGLNASGWHPPEQGAVASAVSTALLVLAGLAVAVGLALRLEGRPRFLPALALPLFYAGHLAVLAGLRALGL